MPIDLVTPLSLEGQLISDRKIDSFGCVSPCTEQRGTLIDLGFILSSSSIVAIDIEFPVDSSTAVIIIITELDAHCSSEHSGSCRYHMLVAHLLLLVLPSPK